MLERSPVPSRALKTPPFFYEHVSGKTSDGWPPACPRCKGKEVSHEEKREYTGGGFEDSWTEFFCDACGWEWRSDVTTGYS